jgi:sialic acid synthase SpsE
MKQVKIGSRLVGDGCPAYVIAEIGSNFDGDLARAKELARLAKECGADAYKIQNFLAPKIVSNAGFKDLKLAFQAAWDKPVVEVYKKAEFPREWVREVATYCKEIGIDFFSSPYDTEAVDLLEDIGVVAHKIGSGEIDNLEFLQYCAKSGKPMILATGASTEEEIAKAVGAVHSMLNEHVILLQCVTNYPSPVGDANLRTLPAFRERYGTLVGYSDHTIGPGGRGDDPLGGLTVPLGAVALGACIIEKHVTDDRTRNGPDHPFAMEMGDFKRMIDGIRALERALGDGKKRVMPSERETVVIQRRSAYAIRDIAAGETLRRDMIEYLRPAVGLRPEALHVALGRSIARALRAGEPLKEEDLDPPRRASDRAAPCKGEEKV